MLNRSHNHGVRHFKKGAKTMNFDEYLANTYEVYQRKSKRVKQSSSDVLDEVDLLID
jgi:hypothetical protein